MKNKLVSIVIPTYNRANLVQETIDSAIAQSYQEKEIIVLDNNSTDNTYNILKDKYKKTKYFRLYKNENTLDIVKNWKKCFNYATGQYILILWSDDLIRSDFLTKTVSFLENNSKAGFVYTLTEIFNRVDGSSKKVFKLKKTGLFEKKVFIKKSLLDPPLSVPVSPANTLFRRNDVNKNLLIDIPNNYSIDYSKLGQGNDNLIFLLTLNDYSHFGYINECLSYFRAHNDSITLSTNSFLVTLRYHIAKAYFINNSNIEEKLILKFNSKIFLIIFLCRLIGIKINFNELYNGGNVKNYSFKYILYFSLKYVFHTIRNFLNKF